MTMAERTSPVFLRACSASSGVVRAASATIRIPRETSLRLDRFKLTIRLEYTLPSRTMVAVLIMFKTIF